ncbi:unnamed protein product [Protopolystoma xenopodis]|uniref:Uncharacterized protein n=1 Tax=Protopolystoma xenopodis TaxID=117903 RepID=A0A3S5CRJ5_9PLAT|nr:unnamed protein product [Protopolystoma xenopodis]
MGHFSGDHHSGSLWGHPGLRNIPSFSLDDPSINHHASPSSEIHKLSNTSDSTSIGVTSFQEVRRRNISVLSDLSESPSRHCNPTSLLVEPILRANLAEPEPDDDMDTVSSPIFSGGLKLKLGDASHHSPRSASAATNSVPGPEAHLHLSELDAVIQELCDTNSEASANAK